MPVLALILTLIALTFIGKVLAEKLISLLEQKRSNELLVIEKLVLCFISGLSFFILITHLLSLLTQSFRFSIHCSLGILTVASIVIYLRNGKNRLNFLSIFFKDSSLYIFSSALLVAIIMYFRDQIFGSPDRIHLAFISSIANNDIYPLKLPVDQSFSLANYHYGTDLIGATIKVISQLPIWEVMSIQIALGSFLAFMGLFILLKTFIQSNKASLAATFFVLFFTSINSIDYFIREISKITSLPIDNFLKNWLMVSWTSISHMTSQLRLPSQNIAFTFCFTLLIISFVYFSHFFKGKTQELNISFAITTSTVSFMLFFCYPAFWYPSLAAITFYGFIDIIQEKNYLRNRTLNLLFFLFLLYLGKILTFCPSEAFSSDVKTLVFDPSLTWVHWGKAYIMYFYDVSYLKTLAVSFDPVTDSNLLFIPLFSSISFRDFGFCIITASILAISQFKKKYNLNYIIFYAAIISLIIPFAFKFILRPIEITRFILFAKIAASIFTASIVFNWLASIKSWTKYVIYVLLGILLVPGLISILPYKSLAILPSKSFTNEEEIIITSLEAIHKSGDVLLDPKDYEIGADFSAFAGFYGVGGQLYKNDYATKRTAYELLNPLLLKELHVKYVIVYNDISVSQKAKQRLENPKLFKNVQTNSTTRLYEFIYQAGDIDETVFKNEYKWALGYPSSTSFQLIKDQQGKIFISNNREELKMIKINLKKSLAKDNPLVAFWLNEQAIINDE